MSLYSTEIAESHPAGMLLLTVIAGAMRDLERRRDLSSAARFFLGPEIVSYAEVLGMDAEALRRRALRLCPDLPRCLSSAAQEHAPKASRTGPPRHERCQRGHVIRSDARGRRYCADCRREHRRAYMRRVRERARCNTIGA